MLLLQQKKTMIAITTIREMTTKMMTTMRTTLEPPFSVGVGSVVGGAAAERQSMRTFGFKH